VILVGKSKDKVSISFVGGNADDVTGSCILVEMEDIKILLECGLYQSNNIAKDYKINGEKFKFKPRDIDYVFLNHAHADHSCLIPRLIKEGFQGQIITTCETARIVVPILYDSEYIIERTAEYLSKKNKTEVLPLYSEEDVHKTLSYVVGYSYNTLYALDDRVSFEWLANGHIIGSASLRLYLRQKNNHVSKIFYTSDIGNIQFKKYYVEDFEKETKTNYLIAEATYANKERKITKKERDIDIQKLKTAIEDICIGKKGRILIPSFSLDRSQNILTVLYEIYHEDSNFKIPIIVDSPLAVEITNIYRDILTGEDKELIEKICSWENVRFIKDKKESDASVLDKSPKIIISSSGMMQAGRVIKYAQSILPDSRSMTIFIGYSTVGSLAWKIKNGKSNKTITINGKPCANRCSVLELRSFSSHIQYLDMLDYYSQVNCEKIYLVHSEQKSKIEFAKELQEKLEKENKTTKVVATNKTTVARL
jgi:metallo-beta-lactamase family protein